MIHYSDFMMIIILLILNFTKSIQKKNIFIRLYYYNITALDYNGTALPLDAALVSNIYIYRQHRFKKYF